MQAGAIESVATAVSTFSGWSPEAPTLDVFTFRRRSPAVQTVNALPVRLEGIALT